MASRTTYTTVTFANPFSLSGFDRPQPGGSYTVRTEEELLEGLSFAAYGRTTTEISLPVRDSGGGSQEVFAIDPQELERALAADCAKIVENEVVRDNLSAARNGVPPTVLEISGALSRLWHRFRFGRSVR
jgi:hypothetical protein